MQSEYEINQGLSDSECNEQRPNKDDISQRIPTTMPSLFLLMITYFSDRTKTGAAY